MEKVRKQGGRTASKPDLRALVGQVLELCDTPRNRANQALNEALLARRPGARPLVFARPLRPYIAGLHGLSLRAAIEEPERFLEMELLTRVSEAGDFDDDTWVSPVLDIWLGVVFEATLLGVGWTTREDTQAWFGEPPLASLGDLSALERAVEEFNFQSTGMMPLAHRIHELGSKVADGGLRLVFPRWFSGNLRMAQKLRGDTNLFVDFHDDPEGVRKVMGLITRLRRRFDQLRAQRFPADGEVHHHFSSYLRAGSVIGNDEVDGNIFGPQTYLDFVFPSDGEFCRDHRDIYFHSCGNLTPMYRHIRRLPNIAFVHVSSLSDFQTAADTFGTSAIYEKAFADWDPAFAAMVSGDGSFARKLVWLCKERGLHAWFMVDVDQADPRSVKRFSEWVRVMKAAIAEAYPV